MKIHSTFGRCLLATAVASFSFTLSSMADDHGEKEETPLAKSMEGANKALKSLRKMEKGDWAAGAEAARTAAAEFVKGFPYLPILIEEMPEGKGKTVAIADYRRLMGVAYANICELELAYLAEDQAKVDEATKKIKGAKKEGHKKYED